MFILRLVFINSLICLCEISILITMSHPGAQIVKGLFFPQWRNLLKRAENYSPPAEVFSILQTQVDKAGNIIWKFHNCRGQVPLYSNLINGSFKEIEREMPRGWILNDRLSEGSGKLIWGKDERGKRCPGLEYDRNGILYLQQNLVVRPGQYYRMGARIRTELEEAIVFLQMAFLDDMGGLICDVAETPKGRPIMETTDWIEDSFEAKAPIEAR